VKKKLFKGYDLLQLKFWHTWVSGWYSGMFDSFGSAQIYFMDCMYKKGLIDHDEYEVFIDSHYIGLGLPLPKRLEGGLIDHDEYQVFTDFHYIGLALPKKLEARILIIKSLLELSIEKTDLEWGIWKNQRVLARKLKLDIDSEEDKSDPFFLVWLYRLKQFKIIE